MADPISVLDHALGSDPYRADFDELRAVAGDLLLARGEPRGELLALERAAADGELEPERYVAMVRAWLRAHEPLLPRTSSGELAYLRELELRGGRLTSVTIDLDPRGEPSGETLTERTDAIVRGLARAPSCRELRALRVRVPRDDQAELCLARVELSARGLPLEQLVISSTGAAIGHQTRNHAVALRRYYPRLWFVTRFGRVTPLIELELLDQPAAWALADLAAKANPAELRVAIGRGLSSGSERTTHVACEQIAKLGPSGEVFAPAIEQLLQPRVSHAAPWLLQHLPSFGAWAQRCFARRLDQMSSDEAAYPADVRSLAGRCRRALETSPDSP